MRIKQYFLHFRYYVCYGQTKPIRFQCPDRLVFNKEQGVCDYPREKSFDEIEDSNSFPLIN